MDGLPGGTSGEARPRLRRRLRICAYFLPVLTAAVRLAARAGAWRCGVVLRPLAPAMQEVSDTGADALEGLLVDLGRRTERHGKITL